MIADLPSNKKLNLVLNELFIRDRKLNISLFFITPSYFSVPKNIGLNSNLKIASINWIKLTIGY